MSTANPERKPKKNPTALDLLHAQTVSQTAAPSPQGEQGLRALPRALSCAAQAWVMLWRMPWAVFGVFPGLTLPQ